MRYCIRILFLSVLSVSIKTYQRYRAHFGPNTYIISETRGKTLEEIAEIFGDDLAFTEYIGTRSSDSEQEPAKSYTMALGADSEHVERVQPHKGI